MCPKSDIIRDAQGVSRGWASAGAGPDIGEVGRAEIRIAILRTSRPVRREYPRLETATNRPTHLGDIVRDQRGSKRTGEVIGRRTVRKDAHGTCRYDGRTCGGRPILLPGSAAGCVDQCAGIDEHAAA